MSSDFPLTVDMLLNVLEVIAPFKHFSKLRQFVLMKLPPGFPVKIDIPILPTVMAKITFQEFAFKNDIDPQLFNVPADYEEDPLRYRSILVWPSSHFPVSKLNIFSQFTLFYQTMTFRDYGAYLTMMMFLNTAASV